MTRHTQTHEANPKAAEITFGCEIECYLPRGSVRVGNYHAGIEIGGRFPAGWNAQRDGSLHTSLPNYEGVEIVSPVLRGREGLEQVRKVAALLEEMGARVNASAGFHVHLGAESAAGQDFDEVADWVRRLINVTSQHEKAFYGASGTRSREQGTYCRSLKSAWNSKKEKLRRKMKADDLPVNMQKMNEGERVHYAKDQQAKRKQLEAQISDLSKKRDEFVSKNAAAEKDSFDNRVFESVKTEAAPAGVAFH